MASESSMEERSRVRRDEMERIAGLVASLPDREPPDSILDTVMARIQPKRAGRFKRLWRKVRTPVPMAPLWPALAGAVAAALLMVAVLPDPAERAGSPEPKALTEGAPGRFKMQWDETRSLWVIRLELGQGRHEYAFLVDGQRAVPDPNARFQEDDGFGNTNSILVVQGGNGHETGI